MGQPRRLSDVGFTPDFGPMAAQPSDDSGPEATSQPLLDHLIGEHLGRVGYIETECFGAFKIDNEIEFGRQLYGELFRFGTL
jgi:hypothetical protein